MDIYGYSNFPYNQSDELAKQMFAQQALASSLPYNREGSHSMPEPTGTPWNMQGIPWGMQSPPHLVHFNSQSHLGQQPQLGLQPQTGPVVHCKRKSLDVQPIIPAKQLITEEKMAAHLSGLHISSDYTTHSLSPNETMDVNMETAVTPLSEKLKGHKIVLADEIRNIKEDPLLPATLIERLEKPQMSLVVWKPRDSILDKIKENEDNNESKHELDMEPETKRRTGVLVCEPYGMDVEI